MKTTMLPACLYYRNCNKKISFWKI